jgi:hypothetical protein
MAVMLSPRLLQPIFECECRGRLCRCGAPSAGDDIKPEDLVIYPRTLWIDPGEHTGWAIVWFDPDVLFDPDRKVSRAPVAWWAGMVVGPEVNHVDYLMGKLRLPGVGGEGLACGAEDFIVHSIKKQRSFLSPVRVSSMFEWALHRGHREPDGEFRRRRMARQAPVDALNTITDPRLRLYDMWLPGADHPRDATRHALLWLRRLKAGGEDFYNSWHFVDEGDVP